MIDSIILEAVTGQEIIIIILFPIKVDNFVRDDTATIPS